MANSINFVGRLGRSPELKELDSGTVCNMSVACNGARKEDPPIWFDVEVWGKRGEAAAEWLKKGQGVFIVGTLSIREFLKKDKTQGFALRVKTYDWEFSPGAPPEPKGDTTAPPADDPSIPF